ncbi:uncharacterized protein J3R85_016603 [Psidium guajava]|nr:uncharacterized protein J3R85_016603 [Psidium guajava]
MTAAAGFLSCFLLLRPCNLCRVAWLMNSEICRLRREEETLTKKKKKKTILFSPSLLSSIFPLSNSEVIGPSPSAKVSVLRHLLSTIHPGYPADVVPRD